MKIVLTGGPSAGKTTIAEVIARIYSAEFKMVPEAASILFRGGFPRSMGGMGMCYQQIAIYQVQKQMENLMELQNPQTNLICDRGTLDGLAYWPEEPESFFASVHSSLTKELSRYDWVIELDTVSPTYYSTNSLRIETAREAMKINGRIREVWSGHPNHIVIENSTNFNKKLARVTAAVDMILRGGDADQIRKELQLEVVC